MASLVAAVAAFAALFSPATARPQTLLTVYNNHIAAFAVDHGYIAYYLPGRNGDCNVVQLSSLHGPIGIKLPLQSQSHNNITCGFVRSGHDPVQLALAGTTGSVLWTLPQAAPLPVDYLVGAGAKPADQPERRFLEVAHTARGVGQWLGGIAGDGATLAWGMTTVDWTNEAGCLAGTSPCTLTKTGGGVYVVDGRNRKRVRGSGPTVELAVSGTSIAAVPTGSIGKDGRPRASADLPIDVVDAKNGKRLASVVPQGVPVAIALSQTVLATLERTALGLRLAWYDTSSGRVRGSVPVPRATVPSLVAGTQLIVFQVGRTLRAVNLRTHATRTLVRAATTPADVALDGNRLAWVENLPGLSRIQALYVSGNG
jgi:hypothetical protein